MFKHKKAVLRFYTIESFKVWVMIFENKKVTRQDMIEKLNMKKREVDDCILVLKVTGMIEE